MKIANNNSPKIHTELDQILAKMQNGNVDAQFMRSACQTVINRFETARNELTEWKKAIFRAERQLDATSESDLKKTFESLDALGSFLLEEANRLLKTGSMPLGKWACMQMKNRNDAGKSILANWTTPSASKAIGLRTRRLSKENEDKLGAILEAQRLDELSLAK